MLLICRHCFLLVTCLWPVEQPRKNGKRSSFSLVSCAIRPFVMSHRALILESDTSPGLVATFPPPCPVGPACMWHLQKHVEGKTRLHSLIYHGALFWSFCFFGGGVIFIVIIICFFKIRKHPPNGSMCHPISIDVLYWSRLGKFHGNVH